MQSEEDATAFPEAGAAVLEGLVACGVCGDPLTHGHTGLAAYVCGSGCRPPTPAAELELRVGRAVLERLWTPAALARLAAAQDLLHDMGYDLSHPVPVSLKHALHQWDHEFDEDLRRSMVSDALMAVVVGPRAHRDEPELFFAWQHRRTDP